MHESLESFEGKIRMVPFLYDSNIWNYNVKDKSVSFYEQLSKIGGTMGLLIGMSVISFWEVIFLLFNFVKEICKSVNSEKRQSLNNSYQRDECGMIKKLEYHVKVSKYCSNWPINVVLI